MTEVMRVARKDRTRWLRYVAPLTVGSACLWLLWNRLRTLDPDALWQSFLAVSPAQWALALVATIVSFWSLGRYDAVIHRHLRTGISARDAQRSGMSSIALAQLLGLGVVTGTLARWRLLPQLGPLRVAQVTAAVSASFLIAWAVVTALACLLLAPRLLPEWLALLGLVFFLTLPAASLFAPELRFARLRLRLPSLKAMGAITFFAAIDTYAAGLALYALLPDPPGFAAFLPVFLLALGAGLFAGTPGGVGPFELSLLALLPALPESDLFAAILAFRLVYYLLPATLAALHIFRPRPVVEAAPRRRASRRIPDLLLDHAPRAECGVARQNGARLLGCAASGALCIDTPQTLTLLFDPLSGGLGPLLPRLSAAARSSNRIPVVYKCSARQALAARKAGWQILHVADDAVIDPGALTLDGAAFRQLRRKLRNAEKAGVTTSCETELPLADLARLDAEWKALHGVARGLSTGRFAPSYVARQRVFGARIDGDLVAYITLHENQNQLCLDLMRHGADLPDGTMHALVTAAAREAARLGLPLSLAAIPARPGNEGRMMTWARAQVAARTGGMGLARFKDSFAPRYQPLYMAAPGRGALALAAADLALAMRRPARTRAQPLPTESALAYEGS
ncbi:phosphatidylglycerol lysyltransferase domain-containing protein [Pseudooceanicola marinus]|uniref:phosphatidylglycerol lysyltransferase domain-containing protein n=1 Tax=Pseudooceanicola marinus TaxID=396013 RepID=UPI001CD53E6D|nr:phosphatidylglycerol lysyltransferase domain-containing protein [Pseudooceanicola marinus]MCA1334101.1 phosphatidylglycerol lysyltransferase domain-containing protein [Pseudooceanicola marinus]